jgi:hypothetical protein
MATMREVPIAIGPFVTLCVKRNRFNRKGTLRKTQSIMKI